MTTTFSDLPAELRIQIWELTLFPRLVPIFTVVADEKLPHTGVVCVKSCMPAPPVVQVCREARQYARYQRAFTQGSNPRYTWINWEYDMISCQWEYELYSLRTLGDWALEDLWEPEAYALRTLGEHASEIQRVHFTHLGFDEDNWEYNWENRDGFEHIRKILSAKELHFFQDIGAVGFAIFKDDNTYVQGIFYSFDIQSFDSLTGLTIIRAWEEYSGGQRAVQWYREGQRDPDVVQNARELQHTMEEMFSPSEIRLMRIRHATVDSPAG